MAQEYIDWPDSLVAATDSARTSLNLHPHPDPRLVIPSDVALIAKRTSRLKEKPPAVTIGEDFKLLEAVLRYLYASREQQRRAICRKIAA